MSPATRRSATPTVCIPPARRPDYCVRVEHPSGGYEQDPALVGSTVPTGETRRPDVPVAACASHIWCHIQTAQLVRPGLYHAGHALRLAFVSALPNIQETVSQHASMQMLGQVFGVVLQRRCGGPRHYPVSTGAATP